MREGENGMLTPSHTALLMLGRGAGSVPYWVPVDTKPVCEVVVMVKGAGDKLPYIALLSLLAAGNLTCLYILLHYPKCVNQSTTCFIGCIMEGKSTLSALPPTLEGDWNIPPFLQGLEH